MNTISYTQILSAKLQWLKLFLPPSSKLMLPYTILAIVTLQHPDSSWNSFEIKQFVICIKSRVQMECLRRDHFSPRKHFIPSKYLLLSEQ